MIAACGRDEGTRLHLSPLKTYTEIEDNTRPKVRETRTIVRARRDSFPRQSPLPGTGLWTLKVALRGESISCGRRKPHRPNCFALHPRTSHYIKKYCPVKVPKSLDRAILFDLILSAWIAPERSLNIMQAKRVLWHMVFERDSYTCVLCDQAAQDVHHVLPRSKGGRDNLHNLIAVCRLHHRILHGDTFKGAGLSKDEARQTVMEYLHDLYAQEIQLGEFFGGW